MSNTTYGPDVVAPDGTVLKSPLYGYIPTESVCIIFVALYSLTTIVHAVQAVHFRIWWLLPTVCLAGVIEIVGWGGRLWSSINPLLKTPFLLQIVTTIQAPMPFLAALFMIFSRIISALGVQYSRLSPQWYTRIFLTTDIVSLTVQGVGGGIAASADTEAGSNKGGNIMLGGIIFQLVALTVFVAICCEYYIRYIKDKPIQNRRSYDNFRVEWDRRLKLLTVGLIFILVFVFIRSIYRTAELTDGWNGTIITTQVYFNVFDGAMIFLAMFTLNVFHPGLLLKTPHTHTHVGQGSSMDGSHTLLLVGKSLSDKSRPDYSMPVGPTFLDV